MSPRTAILLLLFSHVAHADETDRLPKHLLPILESAPFTTEVAQDVVIYFDESSPLAKEKKDGLVAILPVIYGFLDMENVVRCRDNKLRIILVEDALLNDRKAMSFLTWHRWNNQDIWGAYNTSSGAGSREIFISIGVEGDYLNHVAAHEFYHRYQDITCANLSAPSTEPDAVAFTQKFCSDTGRC